MHLKFQTLLLFLKEMLVIKAEILQMHVRVANREDSDQTASEEAVRSGSTWIVRQLVLKSFFGKQLVFKILEHLPYAFLIIFLSEYVVHKPIMWWHLIWVYTVF